MLAELIQKIVELADGARCSSFHTHDKLPHQVFLEDTDGKIEEFDVPPPPRRHELQGFNDILLVVKDEMSSKPEIFVDKQGLTVHLNRDLRREFVALSLVTTDQFDTLCRLRPPKALEPRQAIKMLRYELHGAETENIVQALSRVDFTRTSTGRSVTEHGKESLGRSVEDAVQQADTIPDRFTVHVPIWSNPGFVHHTASIECGVYLDLETQKVEIGVLADEINRALVRSTRAIVKELTFDLGEECPVFNGRP